MHAAELLADWRVICRVHVACCIMIVGSLHSLDKRQAQTERSPKPCFSLIALSAAHQSKWFTVDESICIFINSGHSYYISAYSCSRAMRGGCRKWFYWFTQTQTGTVFTALQSFTLVVSPGFRYFCIGEAREKLDINHVQLCSRFIRWRNKLSSDEFQMAIFLKQEGISIAWKNKTFTQWILDFLQVRVTESQSS